MFGVLKNFLNSEKAMASGLLVIASSAMVATGKITPAEWMAYTETLLGIYVAGKTVQGGVTAHARAKAGTKDAEAKAKNAQAELAKLEDLIASNDEAANAALDAKFGDPSEEPTDPGRKTTEG